MVMTNGSIEILIELNKLMEFPSIIYPCTSNLICCGLLKCSFN